MSDNENNKRKLIAINGPMSWNSEWETSSLLEVIAELDMGFGF